MRIYGLQVDTVSPLPFRAALHAYYFNGRFATSPVSYGRGKVWIDVTGSAPTKAFWTDVETGDASPQDLARSLDARRQAGLGTGGGYCNRDTLPRVLEAIGRREMALWLATLDGTTNPQPELPPNVTLVAVQAFPAAMLGFNADLSVVVDHAYWAGRSA